MEVVNRVSAFFYQKLSKFFWRHCRMTEASKWKLRANKSGLKLLKVVKLSNSGVSVIMMMPNDESVWFHQVLNYIHAPALVIQRDNSDFEAEKTSKGL